MSMRLVGLLVLVPLLLPTMGSVVQAQDETVTIDDLMTSAQEWAEENLDPEALRALRNIDQDKARQLFADLQKHLQGEYVIDLATLRQTATAIVPLLDQYEETQPYAAWLKSQLDYLDVADQFRLIIPPPKVKPGEPPKPRPNPSAKMERDVWIKTLSDRPWPERARPYVPRLKPIFSSEKIPPELVWIAEVESSFDARARSPAGAAGLFQLMPATAKRFGLRRWPLDQRYKPEESAHAAARYLQYLHGHFKDWRLALAAYNAGEGTVEKAMRRYQAATFDDIAIHLPAETQMYVPRIEATVLKREGVNLSQL